MHRLCNPNPVHQLKKIFVRIGVGIVVCIEFLLDVASKLHAVRGLVSL